MLGERASAKPAFVTESQEPRRIWRLGRTLPFLSPLERLARLCLPMDSAEEPHFFCLPWRGGFGQWLGLAHRPGLPSPASIPDPRGKGLRAPDGRQPLAAGRMPRHVGLDAHFSRRFERRRAPSKVVTSCWQRGPFGEGPFQMPRGRGAEPSYLFAIRSCRAQDPPPLRGRLSHGRLFPPARRDEQ